MMRLSGSLLLSVAAILSQNPVQVPSPPIRAQVRVVVVPATVTDRSGHYISGLADHDFVVTDNGRPQNYRMDTSDTLVAPISLLVAVQTSGIAAAALAKVNRIGSMFQPLILGDRGEVAIVGFDDDVRTLQDFTSDPLVIDKAFRELKPAGGGSRMIDAVEASEQMLAERQPNRRRVIVLISETRDRGSKTKLADAVQAAQREGIAIYAATYSAFTTPFTAKPSDLPPPPPSGLLGLITEPLRMIKKNAAGALAKYSGGEHLSFLTQKSLERLVSHLGEELHSQYLLSFSPGPRTEAGFHAIEVTVRDHPEFIIHARPGYWWQAEQ